MGGYKNYFSYLSEEVLAGLPDGENKAFRVSREARSGVASMRWAETQGKRLEAQKLLEKQGFRRSSVSLVDLGNLGLGLEVQPLSCTEVFFRFSTPLFMI